MVMVDVDTRAAYSCRHAAQVVGLVESSVATQHCSAFISRTGWTHAMAV